nr:phospholipase sgr2 [Quercus suber]
MIIEPLVCKEYTNKRPVLIPYHKGGRRLHIGFQEFTEDLATRSHAIMDHLHSIGVKVLTVCQSRSMDSLEGKVGGMDSGVGEITDSGAGIVAVTRSEVRKEIKGSCVKATEGNR